MKLICELSRAKPGERLRLYGLYLRAFPPRERKPFGTIVRMAKEGRADLWTIRMDGRFAGLAAAVNGPNMVLLDYFAVRKTLRGRGVGSAALRMLMERYRDRGFFVEIESTREEAANRTEREKRKRFYVNCGLEPMDTEVDIFGVRMELLGVRCHLDFEGYCKFYREHYNPRVAEHIRPVKEEKP